jgi:sugar phosphate isomerase/epimerase
MQRALSTHLIVGHRLNTVWLDRIRDAGFPLVEIFCARQHLDYHNREQVNELACWFADSDLHLHSLHSPMYNDDVWGRTGPAAVVSITEPSKPRRLASVDEIKRALEVAEKIPCRYLIQHVGVGGEEYSDEAVEAAFRALEDISLFARHRGVEVLLENIPNALSSAERLNYFLNTTHLDLGICLDTGHANMMEGVSRAFEILGPRIRSTHVHDNNGVDDVHLYPLLAKGGTIEWTAAMQSLRSRAEQQYPLLLELRESPDFPQALAAARDVIDRLEKL